MRHGSMPHNRARGVPNLYFVGAGTHPGAGQPGVNSRRGDECPTDLLPRIPERSPLRTGISGPLAG